ncbi:hypothetical protein [Solibacillus sp. CAU 1738]|uniref:hypothetical protein n=1 Tax=Solibacillus sp. CAU 1738 TaxID=3140363 RepID=UPI0032609719
MNTLKGSLYIFFQSYKKQNIVFWIILLSIVLFLIFIDATFGENVKLFLSVSIPVYIFFSIMSSKLLNKTMPYFLKLGLSRNQYALHVGLFFIAWSFIGALFIACIHKGILFSNTFTLHDIIIFHPVYFFDPSLPFFLTFAFDFAILLFSLASGLLINVVFYRLGTVGGYTFIGGLIFIPILAVIFNWYQPLFDLLNNVTFIVLCTSLFFISLLLYGIIAVVLQKASAIPA